MWGDIEYVFYLLEKLLSKNKIITAKVDGLRVANLAKKMRLRAYYTNDLIELIVEKQVRDTINSKLVNNKK